MGAYLRGAQNVFLVGHIPVKNFPQLNYSFDATVTSNRIVSKGQSNFR